MNKIGLIIKREYLRRVSKKSFLLLTFLTPFLFAALVFVPLWLSTIKGDDAKQVAIIDTTGKYASLFKDTEEYTFITEKGSSLEEYRKNPDKEIFASTTSISRPSNGTKTEARKALRPRLPLSWV